ncbi:gluconokinase [Ammoniphilus sp. YIM 78166]|uniref:gluconokinase n=1 Tax=Ammoniphilus sp. YIM 78166 TaxID=1644106 RepID=UPI00106FA854|nr:gluconokinase [Ammoniphilus sp. YIM 78166]
MHVIGLDIGTTSTKAVVFTLQGKVISEHAVEYPIFTPSPAWAEQDPEQILRAAEEAIRVAVEKSATTAFLGVGISSAMHSLLLMDEQGSPLTRTIIWADNRSIHQSEKLLLSQGREIYLRTGTPIHPMSPLSKILWFKEEQPELFTQVHKFISIKDYLLYRWFGRYVIDYSLASATGLFNLEQLDYDTEVLQLLGIHKDQLPDPVPTTHVLQGMNPEHARAMGIGEDMPFVIGGSDGCLANLGIGAMEKGDVAITIGTSGAIRTVVPEPLTDTQMRTFCYALADKQWVIGGPTNNGGILLRWFRDQFAPGASYDELAAEAAIAGIGSGGLLCLPYLSGERAPIWNADARGCFFGMALHHQRGHFVRAAMEGVIYSVYSVGKALQDLSGDFRSVRASGGFVQSPLWCQILSDIFGAPVEIPESHQSSSWGAALLVLYALGEMDRLDAYKDQVPIRQTYLPNPLHHQQYQSLYEIYQEVYTSLEGSFGKIATYQRRL